MRVTHFALASALFALATLPLAAQSNAPARKDDGPIVVTGSRSADGKPIPMSDWRVAETPHVIVYGKGDADDLTRTAHNLEKLHFLLSVLLNRVDEPDNVIKLRVTMIGDTADFNNLGLSHVQRQPGPYPKAFPRQIYYDPREDGAVLATTRIDQKIILQPATRAISRPDIDLDEPLSLHPDGTIMFRDSDEISIPVPADGRLYAGFARHYLMTYFPNAYPRWYVEGFGEIFSTFVAPKEGVIEYGRLPGGYRRVLEHFRIYSVQNVFNGRYLLEKDKWWRPDWTPYHALALAHLLFFSEEWEAPLHKYLAATARGANETEAAAAFGDLDKLQARLSGYRGRKVPYEQLTYSPERIPPPLVRRLRQSEAGFVRGRLELGARVELPGEAPAGADPATVEKMKAAQREAIGERKAWLEELRRDATLHTTELEVQLLLTEAECRSGNNELCAAAADRALALAPASSAALAWKGLALARQAATRSPSERSAMLKVARATIARANRADTESVLPLLAYYRSFAETGEAAPDVALDGLAKSVDLVPAAPGPRLMLGAELAARGYGSAAARLLRPVAAGPYQTREQPRAQAVLETLKTQ